MDRLRVLHVGKFYPPAPGGMERIVQSLCEGAPQHIESAVLVANSAARTVRERRRGVDVTRVASLGAIGSVGVCPAFPIELRRARRDVTVVHEPNPIALVSDFLARQHGPLVVWFHSEVLRPRWKYRLLYRPFLRRVLRRASRIVVSSPNLASHAMELHDFRDKCVVIPFGIDTERLRLTPAVEERAGHIARSAPGGKVLFAGRLVAYKGVHVLIDAMREINATTFIVGDGPERRHLQAQAERMGVAERVRFVGAVPDEELVAHLHACDVVALPSVTCAETFGVVQLEAMACGKPVVSTNLPTGVPWVNRHEETGLVVPPADARALASALNRLLRDPSWRVTLGSAARRRVAEAFTVERMAAQSAALYLEVVEGSTRALSPLGSGSPSRMKV